MFMDMHFNLAAWKQLAVQHHPDKTANKKSQRKMIEINVRGVCALEGLRNTHFHATCSSHAGMLLSLCVNHVLCAWNAKIVWSAGANTSTQACCTGPGCVREMQNIEAAAAK